MDVNLEEEIERLSRPADGSRREEPVPPVAAAPLSTPILQPQRGRLAESENGSSERPLQARDQRLRRGSSGSNSGGNLRSPHRTGLMTAAVLAGNSISDLQVPTGSSGSSTPEQQHRQGGGSGGLVASNTAAGASNGTGGRASAAPRPKLAANGEKMAGPSLSRPILNGEKIAPMRSAVFKGEKVAGFGGAAAGGKAAAGPKGGVSNQEEAWKRSEAALKRKEQSVRDALREKQRTLQQESLLLATVDRELAQLALDHQEEVNELRKTLEVVDRELAFLDRDAQKKLEAFEKARTALSAKVTEKQGITTRLTELILASERKRDAKLNEIMKKMSVDGGKTGDPGRAAGGAGGTSH